MDSELHMLQAINIASASGVATGARGVPPQPRPGPPVRFVQIRILFGGGG